MLEIADSRQGEIVRNRETVPRNPGQCDPRKTWTRLSSEAKRPLSLPLTFKVPSAVSEDEALRHSGLLPRPPPQLWSTHWHSWCTSFLILNFLFLLPPCLPLNHFAFFFPKRDCYFSFASTPHGSCMFLNSLSLARSVLTLLLLSLKHVLSSKADEWLEAPKKRGHYLMISFNKRRHPPRG